MHVMEPASPLPVRPAGAAALSACYQCRKCSGGCPLTFAMDLLPDRVIRLALLGQEEAVLSCRTIWVCSGCETCTTRCPNGIDIAGVMDRLKEEARRRGLSAAQPQVARFHETFLQTVRLTGGRMSEPLLLALYQLKNPDLFNKLKSGALSEDLRLAWELLRRGRLVPRFPRRLKGGRELKALTGGTGRSEP